MSKLLQEIAELKNLSYEQLMDKRSHITVERIKLESKLNRADADKRKDISIDEDWYSRCNYAYMKAGTLITAIDNEVSIRKHKEKVIFSDVFVRVTKETLPTDLFDALYQQAQLEYRKGKV